MRYVLLKHEDQDDFHVDFLLDCGEERLLTWQISDEKLAIFLVDCEKNFNFAESPDSISNKIYSNCRRIFDHRREYLDFSGDLGDHRGYVTRVECGTWELIELDAQRLVIKTFDTRLVDNSPTVKQWQFEPPGEIVLAPCPRLMQQLPPPDEGIWLVSCSFLC